MCGGVYYFHNNEPQRVYFPNPAAQLPVQLKGTMTAEGHVEGATALLPWGRRQKQPGTLPMGGWARLESIYAGHWDKYFPVPIKIPVVSFMEKDIEGNSHWFDITRGQFIQGLAARSCNELRIYVVTIQPEMENAVHDRWPRVMSGI